MRIINSPLDKESNGHESFCKHISSDSREDLDQAGQECREVLKTDSENSEILENHYKSALILHSKGFLDQAINEYREALKVDPGVAEVHLELGNALFAKG